MGARPLPNVPLCQLSVGAYRSSAIFVVLRMPAGRRPSGWGSSAALKPAPHYACMHGQPLTGGLPDPGFPGVRTGPAWTNQKAEVSEVGPKRGERRLSVCPQCPSGYCVILCGHPFDNPFSQSAMCPWCPLTKLRDFGERGSERRDYPTQGHVDQVGGWPVMSSLAPGRPCPGVPGAR